jgi:hypothetical protein
MILALGKSTVNLSRSHMCVDSDAHEPKALPASPVTAMTLLVALVSGKHWVQETYSSSTGPRGELSGVKP